MGIDKGIFTPPLDYDAIADYLGMKITDAGKLWVETDWNIWSQNKPMVDDSELEITPERKKELAYGFVEGSVYPIASDSSELAQAFEDAKNGVSSWIYNKPTTETLKFRASDINYYNHNAVCPFFFEDESMQGRAILGIGQYAQLPQYNITVEDLAMVISNDVFGANVSYGVLYCKDDAIYGLAMEAIDEIDGPTGVGAYPVYDVDGKPLFHSIDIGGAGDYECVPVIGAFNRGQYYVLPLAPLQLSVAPYVEPAPKLSGVWGISETGNKVRVQASLEATYKLIRSGVVSVFFFSEEPEEGVDWAASAVLVYNLDYPDIEVGSTYEWDKVIELLPSDISVVKAKTIAAEVEVIADFQFTEF